MEELLNEKVRGIEISGIRKFYNLVSKYDNAISLTIGQPDFETPKHIKEVGKNAIDNNKTVYTANAGLIELRKAACNYVQNKYDLTYNPENEVIITNGASEAIDVILRTLLSQGDEVILPGPVYPGYEPIIKLCRAVPIHADVRDSNFKLTSEKIVKHITPKTKCIILPYPSNPTGCTLSAKEIMDIANVLKDKNIFVLSDEIYSELVYDEKHTSIASIESMRDKTIVINGLSKSHSMTGWRIGLLFAPEYITKHMLKVHQYNATCACTISQYAALEGLKNGPNDAEAMKNEYIKRRNYVYERLISMGFEVSKPNGAFYIFPSIKKLSNNSFEFASDLLDKERLAVVPGSAFSEFGEGYIRISYAYSMNLLSEGLDRLQKYIQFDK